MLTPESSSTLAANTDYYVVLQTINLASLPSQYGITFPTGVGTFKIDLTAQSDSLQSTIYVDVVSATFTQAILRSYVSIMNEWNILDLTVQPSTQIATSDQLVIEIATKSNEGVLLLADDAGSAYIDGQILPFDLIQATGSATSCTCRFYRGV